jgi:hypothetical protein
MIRRKTAVILCCLFFLVYSAQSQHSIGGTIQDAESGEFLPAANIQIAGTLKGTISNQQGDFSLTLDSLPATLIVSYIGYATARVSITDISPRNLIISLQPIAYELEPIIVTGEDPAIRIMREVIRRKALWRSTLNSFAARAYTRLVLENDTSITSIMESISTVYWDRERGIREVVHSRRQTSNMAENENFASVGIITNLYDDNIEIAGFDIIGVTHPDALDHYHFQLEGQRRRDKQIIYDISVRPKSKLQPTFVGKIAVLDSAFALLEVDLTPSDAVLFPTPIKDFSIRYIQQFNNFGTDYWLPIDMRVMGSIKIGFIGLQFPKIIIKRLSRLTDYQINSQLPDSLFEKEESVTIDSTRIQADPDSVFTANPEVIPYSDPEKQAYGSLDSTMTLEKAYRPTGPLARFVEVETDSEEGDSEKPRNTLLYNISPILTYDRVDEATIGLNKGFKTTQLNLKLFGGYKTGRSDWFYGGELRITPERLKPWQFLFKYYDKTDTRYESNTYPLLFTSIHTFLGYRDYFDFYRNRKFHATASFHVSGLSSRFRLGMNLERHQSLQKSTDYNVLGRDIVQRENPQIPEGNLNSLEFEFISDEDYIPWGIVGQNFWKLYLEYSSPDVMNSEFDFLRVAITGDFRIPTFLRRRLLPNTLDVHLVAATSRGDLPPQRFSSIDGTLQIFSPFSVLRTLISKAYEGEKHFGIFWEHNFRTVPFELLGLQSIARNNISIILHGASARSWISEETLQNLSYTPVYVEQFHHELGLSVNGLFDLFRFDFTQRLDQKDFYIGFSFSRLF